MPAHLWTGASKTMLLGSSLHRTEGSARDPGADPGSVGQVEVKFCLT